jgi:ABC-type bacteriocin/lantibiotic exporter with double-glycine peptidase domain
MTTAPAEMQALGPRDSRHPGPDEVVEIVSGEVMVFAVTAAGRRLFLARLGPGRLVVGCPTTAEGTSLLVTGLADARVRTWAVGEVLDAGRTADIDEWVFTIGEAARNGRWAERVVAPDAGALRLAPGEQVAAHLSAVALTDHSVQGWLRVSSGSARYCGLDGVDIGVMAPPVPVTRGAWLTSGLRCQIARAPGPRSAEEWVEALGFIGQLGLRSLESLDRDRNARRLAHLQGVEQRSLLQAQTGVARLVGALLGRSSVELTGASRLSPALVAAFMVADASGLHVDAEDRTRAAEEVQQGRDPLMAAAEACRARAREVDLVTGWWRTEGPPMVGATTSGTVVVLQWRTSGWVALDPKGIQPAIEIDQATVDQFESRASELVPVLPAAPSTLADLGRLTFGGSRHELVISVAMTVLVAAAAFVIPFVFGAISESFAEISGRSLIEALVALGLLLVASLCWQLVRGRALLRARARGGAIAMGAVWDRMMRLPTTWHDRRPLGMRLTQATAVNVAAAGVPDAVIAQLLDTVIVLGSLAAIATTNLALFVSLTVLAAVQMATNYLLVKASAVRAAERVEAGARASGLLIETLRSANRLRVFGAEARAFQRWAMVHAELTRADLRLRWMVTVQTLLIAAWPLVGLILVVIVAPLSHATFGNFVTAQTAAAVFSATIAAATIAYSSMLVARASIDTIAPVLEAVPEGYGGGENPGTLHGEISIRDIVFRYTPGGPRVLDGVSFHVSPGEHVAVVGASGCGKSTLVRVLLGLEDAESGTIAVDGKDLASLNRPAVRRQIGCVLQSSALLPGSIRANVAMGRRLTNAEIWDALDAAAVGDEVRAMARGLDSPVVEGGTSLSGGERQRILIARALAGRPRMLVLDESTSALDNETQQLIVGSVESLRITRVVVAHRLSTVKRADRIIVLDGGAVVQQGTYDELMAAEGPFRELAAHQLV